MRNLNLRHISETDKLLLVKMLAENHKFFSPLNISPEINAVTDKTISSKIKTIKLPSTSGWETLVLSYSRNEFGGRFGVISIDDNFRADNSAKIEIIEDSKGIISYAFAFSDHYSSSCVWDFYSRLSWQECEIQISDVIFKRERNRIQTLQIELKTPHEEYFELLF